MPASLRYVPLFRALGGGSVLLAHELALYAAAPAIPAGYSMEQEVDALDRATHAAGLERFHLYGHSGGGAVALAYVAAHPERVISLALDEPSTDFSQEDLTSPYWSQIRRLRDLPAEERIPAFRRLQVRPGVDLAPLPDRRPSWMEHGPERIAAFSDAVARPAIPFGRYRAFDGPVYYSYGGLTHPRYDQIRARLSSAFRDLRAELYLGLHHLECSHQVEPDRVASALRALWRSSEHVGRNGGD